MPFRHLALQSPCRPCRSKQFRRIAFRSMPCRSRSSPSPAMPLPHTALLNFAVAGRCYALAHDALLMAMPMRFLSRQCPCSTVPRFAIATPRQPLPLLGYESVTIVTPKNTEVKSKWIRKRKFGVLHKRRGFVLCVSHKWAGSGAVLCCPSGNATTMRSAAR